MPILPIDLQTLFGQGAQVGKEQAVQKEAAPQAQSLQGSLLVQQTQTRDTSVNETRQQEQGPEQVKDRARRGAERRRRAPGKGPAAPAPRKPAAEPLRDPALGRHVDITG